MESPIVFRLREEEDRVLIDYLARETKHRRKSTVLRELMMLGIRYREEQAKQGGPSLAASAPLPIEEKPVLEERPVLEEKPALEEKPFSVETEEAFLPRYARRRPLFSPRS